MQVMCTCLMCCTVCLATCMSIATALLSCWPPVHSVSLLPWSWSAAPCFRELLLRRCRWGGEGEGVVTNPRHHALGHWQRQCAPCWGVSANLSANMWYMFGLMLCRHSSQPWQHQVPPPHPPTGCCSSCLTLGMVPVAVQQQMPTHVQPSQQWPNASQCWPGRWGHA
jgi:hypothetical protein